MTVALSASDVGVALGRDLSRQESAALEQAIKLYTREAESLTGRSIGSESKVDTKLYSPPYPADVIQLDRLPVSSITSVSVTYPGQTPTELSSSDFMVDWRGVVLLGLGLFPDSDSDRPTLTITYVGGLVETDAIAFTMLDAVMTRAMRAVMKNVADAAVGVESLSVEGYTVKYMAEDWTDAEMRKLKTYRVLVAY